MSTVIATLLIILLVLIIIGIVWVVVSKIISEKLEITRVQSEFFGEDISFVSVNADPNNGLILSTSIRTSSGSMKIHTESLPAPPAEISVVSVVDLSGSMRDCLGANYNCCHNVLHGWLSSSPHCYGVPFEYINLCETSCGGTLYDGLTSSQNANKQLIDTLLNDKDNNRVGLVAYNSEIVEEFSSELTEDDSSLITIINSWEAEEYTCICCGINDAKDKLSGIIGEKQKAIIVMSDGEANRECPSRYGEHSKQDAIDAACDAYEELTNLIIYAVGLGNDVDDDTMQAIADCGHGIYYHSENIDDLIEIYESVKDEIIQTSRSFYKFIYLKIIFYDSVGNSLISKIDVPAPLETETFEFDLTETDLTAPIVKIEIYPVALTHQGKEVIGPLFDVWEKK